MMIGIYCITNIQNNKKYIGKSFDIEKRINGHKKMLNEKFHHNFHLQNSWEKYGENNFVFEIIEFGNFNNDELNKKEMYWINFYKSYNPQYGYNKTYGGDGGILTKEIREKISKSSMGKILSNETKSKLSIAFSGKNNPMYGKRGSLHPGYGLKRSQEFKDNLSKKLKGHKVSKEQVEKMLKHRRKYVGENNPFYGKKHSNDTKMKISNANKGRKLSDEHKQLLLSINTGRIHTEESKLKMAKARYKLLDNQVIEILDLLKNSNELNKKEVNKLMKEIGKKYNVSDKTINRIRLNETYTHIERGNY